MFTKLAENPDHICVLGTAFVRTYVLNIRPRVVREYWPLPNTYSEQIAP